MQLYPVSYSVENITAYTTKEMSENQSTSLQKIGKHKGTW